LLIQADGTADLEDTMKRISAQEVDLAVCPEYAYTTSPKSAMNARQGPGELVKRLGCPVVFGAVEGSYGEEHFQNVAVVLDADAKLIDTFPKQRPVPMMRDGDPGSRRPVFPVEQGVLGVGVCYDFDAPEVAHSLLKQDATVLVVPTHDSPSWGWVRNYHHGLLLRLRAVECDRWVLRAVNTGRSEAIDPHGVPSVDGVGMGQRDYVAVKYGHRSGVPLGSRAHVLGPGAAGISALLMIGYGVQAWRRRKWKNSAT
jgi:apolipoprotein N-acyltransferase